VVDSVDAYCLPYRATVPAQFYAWLATRHMKLFGTPFVSMGAIAIAERKHAQLNERAMTRPAAIDGRISRSALGYISVPAP